MCENMEMKWTASSLIPKDKHDKSTISELMRISEEEVIPILPQILDWIADMNWPIATDMIKVLIRFPNSLVNPIKQALAPKSEDVMLKYWIIKELLPQLTYEAQYALWVDFVRISENPTEVERTEGVDVVAYDFNKRFCINNGLGLEL